MSPLPKPCVASSLVVSRHSPVCSDDTPITCPRRSASESTEPAPISAQSGTFIGAETGGAALDRGCERLSLRGGDMECACNRHLDRMRRVLHDRGFGVEADLAVETLLDGNALHPVDCVGRHVADRQRFAGAQDARSGEAGGSETGGK